MTLTVRLTLALTLVGVVAVFVIASRLNPYDAEGLPREMGTHEQLGLPPCSFKAIVGKPCPSCGMTTSFAFLVRGDLGNSIRANWVGSLLAVFGALLLPWIVFCLARRRLLGIASLERGLTWVVVVFLLLSFLRWGIALATSWKSV